MAIVPVRRLCARQNLAGSGAFLLPSCNWFAEKFSAAVATHSWLYRIMVLMNHTDSNGFVPKSGFRV